MARPVVVGPYRAYFHYHPESPGFPWSAVVVGVDDPPPPTDHKWYLCTGITKRSSLWGARWGARRLMHRLNKADQMNARARAAGGELDA